MWISTLLCPLIWWCHVYSSRSDLWLSVISMIELHWMNVESWPFPQFYLEHQFQTMINFHFNLDLKQKNDCMLPIKIMIWGDELVYEQMWLTHFYLVSLLIFFSFVSNGENIELLQFNFPIDCTSKTHYLKLFYYLFIYFLRRDVKMIISCSDLREWRERCYFPNWVPLCSGYSICSWALPLTLYSFCLPLMVSNIFLCVSELHFYTIIAHCRFFLWLFITTTKGSIMRPCRKGWFTSTSRST